MENAFTRTEMVLGRDALTALSEKKVAIFGVGGVGGYVCEALVRSGVGHFVLVDKDEVSLTNLNRQIIALHSTIGRAKVDVMKERMLDINPEADIDARRCFFLPENQDEFNFAEYDYVVDAVDTVTAKIAIIMKAKEAGVPVISAMGAGNKMDPSRFQVTDIFKTTMCPLAKVMRHEMKKRGVKKLKVVYSDELPRTPLFDPDEEADAEMGKSDGFISGKFRKKAPGSLAFVPSVAGLLLASEVIKDMTKDIKKAL